MCYCANTKTHTLLLCISFIPCLLATLHYLETWPAELNRHQHPTIAHMQPQSQTWPIFVVWLESQHQLIEQSRGHPSPKPCLAASRHCVPCRHAGNPASLPGVCM